MLPAANVVRLVGVFWADVAPSSPSMEMCAPADTCCVDDATTGYFAPHCLEALKSVVRKIAEAGLWVILAAKARFAAGEGWPKFTDVFHDQRLVRIRPRRSARRACLLQPAPVLRWKQG
eukprot:1022651-Pleurochrysis_carterae.AAC.1